MLLMCCIHVCVYREDSIKNQRWFVCFHITSHQNLTLTSFKLHIHTKKYTHEKQDISLNPNQNITYTQAPLLISFYMTPTLNSQYFFSGIYGAHDGRENPNIYIHILKGLYSYTLLLWKRNDMYPCNIPNLCIIIIHL